MKNHFPSDAGAPASPTAHKDITQRDRGAKTASHRHERRRIREWLRQGNPATGDHDL